MSTAPGIRVPGTRDTPDGSTPLSDPLLHADTRKRICQYCQDAEAKLECASCARVYCHECSRSAHRLAKNSNHRVTFIDVRPAGVATPSRASLRDRETLDDILNNIGSAIKPEVARLDERNYGMPELSINMSRTEVRENPEREDEVAAPASHGSLTESLLGLDDRAEHRKYLRRVGITVGVMVLLFLSQVARTCYLYGGVLLGDDVPIDYYTIYEGALNSLGYTGLKHGFFVLLGVLSFAVSCNFAQAFPRSLFNIYSISAGAFMIVATVTSWWRITQMSPQEIEENVMQIFFAFSIIFVPWASVFFRRERATIRIAVICLNLAVGGMLAFYSVYSSLSIPPVSTTMLVICSVFIFPPLFLAFLRLSAYTVGVTKSLFGVGLAVVVILIPVSIVAERQLWHDVFHHGHAVVLKLAGALAIDIFILTLTTTLACLLPMSDFGYYVYVALMFSDRRLGLSLVQGTYSWNVYHVVGLCLMILSFIVWCFDLKTYLDKKNKFL